MGSPGRCSVLQAFLRTVVSELILQLPQEEKRSSEICNHRPTTEVLDHRNSEFPGEKQREYMVTNLRPKKFATHTHTNTRVEIHYLLTRGKLEFGSLFLTLGTIIFFLLASGSPPHTASWVCFLTVPSCPFPLLFPPHFPNL